MKKTISLILALVLCLSLCACGHESNGNDTDNAQPSAKDQLTDLEKTLFDNLRTPLVEIASTGGIEQRFRLD